jgi:hypothetical protein
MIVNIIHDKDRVLKATKEEDAEQFEAEIAGRYKALQKEIEIQGLEVRYWPAVQDPLNRSFVGIGNAHKQIVRDAKERKLPRVCVAEDDLYFFAPGAWEYFLNNIPEDYDIYLGVVFHGLKEDNTADDFCGLGLYVVNDRFYDTFLSLPEVNHIDRSLARKGRYVVCDPMVCSQRGGYSFNKRKRDTYDRYLVGKRLFGQ